MLSSVHNVVWDILINIVKTIEEKLEQFHLVHHGSSFDRLNWNNLLI